MYGKLILDNGIRLIYEEIPYLRSASVGIFVKTGTVNENKKNNGVSHFVEHMFFKGTSTRTAKDIAEEIDGIGGQLNAYTGKESTGFYAKVLDNHLDIAVDILSDMFLNSTILQKDMDVEKNVVIEEISMYNDSPEDLVHDKLAQIMWKNMNLGMPVLGTEASLKRINRKNLNEYIDKNYAPKDCVVCVVGNIKGDNILELFNKKFGQWNRTGNDVEANQSLIFLNNKFKEKREIDQVHMCLGFEGLPLGDERNYPLSVMNIAFGGGMSSRLFQKIREDAGLAYSIYSYQSSYLRGGAYTIYAGTRPQQIERVTAMIFDEIKELRKNGLTKIEIDRAKEHLKGSYMLGLESASGRMNSLGSAELLLNRIKTPDEIIQKIEGVEYSDISDIIQKILIPEKYAISLIGDIK